jgi:hypothetical protein
VIAVKIGVQEYLDRLIQNGSHSRYNFIWQWRKHVMDENNPIIAHAHSDIAALPARQHVNYFATGTTLSSTLEKSICCAFAPEHMAMARNSPERNLKCFTEMHPPYPTSE